MAVSEAFNTSFRDEQAPLRINDQMLASSRNALDRGGHLTTEVQNAAKDVQMQLTKMAKEAKGRWNMNDDEFKLAMLTMENELEETIPDQFRTEYANAHSPEAAARAITEHILGTVNEFILGKVQTMFEGTLDEVKVIVPGRFDLIAEQAAGISTFSVNKKEAIAFLNEMEPGISDGEINHIWAAHQKATNDFDEGGQRVAQESNSRKTADAIREGRY